MNMVMTLDWLNNDVVILDRGLASVLGQPTQAIPSSPETSPQFR